MTKARPKLELSGCFRNHDTSYYMSIPSVLMPLYAVSKGRFTFGPFTVVRPPAMALALRSSTITKVDLSDSSLLLPSLQPGDSRLDSLRGLAPVLMPELSLPVIEWGTPSHLPQHIHRIRRLHYPRKGISNSLCSVYLFEVR
ncbi:hypothetical protein VNO80_33817 [Phaseolus coccineus]|uniref:Uncharacterized protein n=1 Tax=Phaseolus coccineus TaxID=3886 RepID=A0AAN9Q867_PHACN